MLLVAARPATGQTAPEADHHQHLFSPAVAQMVTGQPQGVAAADLVGLLDQAGIRRAAVLSVAYMFGSPGRTVEDEYAKVRAENDWTAEQAARYPERLRALCSVNPLKEYALEELARCAANPNLRHGLKLHFGNSDVQLENPAHAERLAQLFRLANERRMAIVVHMRASIDNKRPYGAGQARIFLERLLPLVPDVVVQIAHMAGSGPGYADVSAHAAMAVLAEAAEKRDPRMRQVWFDVATSADFRFSAENGAMLVKQIRQVGASRILYGSDGAVPPNLMPRDGWAAFRRLPLTNTEVETIAKNVAPYLR